MSWPVPVIQKKKLLTPPDYKLWIIILFIISITGLVISLFIGKVTEYGQALLYGVLPAFLLWLFSFALVFCRYEHSVNSSFLWDEETERTKKKWREWSSKQLAVIANTVLTPEDKGIGVMMGEYSDVPAFPQKARPLSDVFIGDRECLKFIDQQSESQCPGYRHYLTTIRILHTDEYHQRDITQMVYDIWDLFPEYVSASDGLYPGLDGDEPDSHVLLICLQGWPYGNTGEYSEFITGQLITSVSFARQHNFTVQAGVGRILPSNMLTDDLDVIFEYNDLEYSSLHDVWMSGTGADERASFVQYAALKEWALPGKMPFRLLDHTFGPPGPLMFPVSVALLTDAAIRTGRKQLLIAGHPQYTYSLRLITRDLLL